MEPKNREQRRREKFGKTGGETKVPWPASEPNPALQRSGDDKEAHTGRPDQDVTHQTGPGTGGATEDADRIVDHEGSHPSKRPKG